MSNSLNQKKIKASMSITIRLDTISITIGITIGMSISKTKSKSK